jgi:hypothetical protein
MGISKVLRQAPSAIVLAGAIAMAGDAAIAQPLIEDAFDYPAGPLAGNGGGTGWAGPWAITTQTASTSSINVVEGSLIFSDSATTGNRVNLSVEAGSGFQGIIGQRFVSQSVSAGELWASFLYRRTDEDPSTVSRTAEVRVDTSPIHFGLKAKGPSSQGIRVRYEGSDGLSSAATSVQDGATYLMVGRFTNLGTTDMSGVGTMWALSEADYDSIAFGGVSVEELDAAATLIASDTTSVADAKDLQIGDPIALVNFTSSYPFAFDIDELRYGTSLADVVPGSDAGPPGDFNGDKVVNGDDLNIWQTSFGTDGADANGDDITDGTDFLTWQRNLGLGAPNLSGALSAVPEPSAIASLLVGSSLLFGRRAYRHICRSRRP